MPSDDTNQNGIPDKYDRIIGGLIMLVDAVFSAFVSATASSYEWAPWVHGAQAGMPVLAGWFVLRGRPSGAPVACLLALVLFAGCGSQLKTAAGVTLAVAEARNATDAGIATAFRARMKVCKKDMAKYKACMDSSKEMQAMLLWRPKLRPAVSSAIIATETALRLWQMSGKKPKWMDYLKPGVCGVLNVITRFGHLFPDNGQQVLAFLNAAEGVTCD
jgi:hypothetical protein